MNPLNKVFEDKVTSKLCKNIKLQTWDDGNSWSRLSCAAYGSESTWLRGMLQMAEWWQWQVTSSATACHDGRMVPYTSSVCCIPRYTNLWVSNSQVLTLRNLSRALAILCQQGRFHMLCGLVGSGARSQVGSQVGVQLVGVVKLCDIVISNGIYFLCMKVLYFFLSPIDLRNYFIDI